jgi:MFS family permease
MTAIAVRARRRLDGSTLSLALPCLAQLMLILDAAVVAVALPAIQADLDLPSGQQQAISTAYAVTFGGS